jgi:TonB family protein
MQQWLLLIAFIATVGSPQAGTSDAPVRLPFGATGPKKLRDVRLKFPRTWREELRSGFVILDSVIGEDGRVESVDLLLGTDGEVNEAAMRAVRKWVYEPPILEGRPVRLAQLVPMTFTTSLAGGQPQLWWLRVLLLQAVADRNPLVREAACGLLAAQGEMAVDPLTRALTDENPRVRAAAAAGLGGIGRAARKAIPALKQAARDEDAAVRAAVARTLEAVESE